MMLEHGHLSAFYPRCTKDYASRVGASNVTTDITAYSAPSSYAWPKCPEDCPFFVVSENFTITASQDQYEHMTEGEIEQSGAHTVGESNKASLEPPAKVTVPWLLKHVSASLWISALGVLLAAFLLGVNASRLSFVKELFGLE